jgi:hypothetical protein
MFDGKHEFDMVLAEHWFKSQYSAKEIANVTN